MKTECSEKSLATNKGSQSLKFKVILDNREKDRPDWTHVETVVNAEEAGNNSPYGCGQYIRITGDEIPFTCRSWDFRYMIHYNLKDAVKEALEEMFRKNLTSVEVIEGDAE
jgi:hypothetical protein